MRDRGYRPFSETSGWAPLILGGHMAKRTHDIQGALEDLDEAEETIERLRSINADLLAALEEIAVDPGYLGPQNIARRAITKTKSYGS